MPRFAVLRHEMPQGAPRATHWDFMLEQDGALRTWALDEAPLADADIPALELAVHRVAYLQYEGPVSGDRGSVSRWDEGEFEVVQESADQLELKLSGKQVCGQVYLARQPQDPLHWTFRLASG